jgi:O-antigen/teichoic acid export membrane protein
MSPPPQAGDGRDGVLARLTVRRIAIESLATTVASALVKGRGLLMIVLIAYAAGLTAYGVWILVMVLVNLLAILGGLGLFNGIVRFYPTARDAAELRALFWGGATLVAAASGLAGLVLVAGAPLIADAVAAGDDSFAFRIGGLLVVGLACRLYLLSWIRARDQVGSYARWSSAGELVDLAVAGSLVLLTGSIDIALGGSAAAAFGMSAVLLVRTRREVGPWTGRGAPTRELLRYSLPLVPLSLSDETLARSDRLVVGAVLGPLEAGLYAVVYSLASVVSLLHGALTTMFFPKQVRLEARHAALADRWLLRIAGVFLACAMAQGVVLALVGEQLVSWLVDGAVPDEPIPLLLVVITLGVALYGVGRIVGTKLLVAKRTGRAALVWGGAAVANLALNLVLVPAAGLTGAAISTVVAYGLALVVLVRMTWSPGRAAAPTATRVAG